MSKNYDDIINMARPISKHKKMSLHDRAAQFSPFAALTGYDDAIIMASGSFTQGSSIEISCDGPLRKPYIAYLQGGLTYEHGKIALIKALEKIM